MSVPDNWDDELVDFARPAVALDCCCAICLDPRDRPDDMALLLPCEHRCDADCIEQWRARQPDLLATCPLCRSPIDRVVVGAQLGAKLPAAPDDDGEWVVDAAVLDAKSRDNAAAADVVVVEIARSRAAAPRGRRHRGVAPQHDVRRDQFFSYIDHDDDCHDDQLSQWCAVEDALLERALQANERRRREKNWMERDW